MVQFCAVLSVSDGPITMDLSLKIAMEIFERNIHKIYITFVLIIKVFVIICSMI